MMKHDSLEAAWRAGRASYWNAWPGVRLDVEAASPQTHYRVDGPGTVAHDMVTVIGTDKREANRKMRELLGGCELGECLDPECCEVQERAAESMRMKR